MCSEYETFWGIMKEESLDILKAFNINMQLQTISEEGIQNSLLLRLLCWLITLVYVWHKISG